MNDGGDDGIGPPTVLKSRYGQIGRYNEVHKYESLRMDLEKADIWSEKVRCYPWSCTVNVNSYRLSKVCLILNNNSRKQIQKQTQKQ